MESFNQSLPDNSQLCADDIDKLGDWFLDQNLTSDYANHLTIQGWNDLKFLAINFQKAFGNLIQPKYSKEKFKFGFTNTQRTEASYKAFVEGIFGPDADKLIVTKPEPDHSILLWPTKPCKKYHSVSQRVKQRGSEYHKFQKSSVFKKTLKEFSARLGLNYTLSPRKLDLIWDMCRYEQAWYFQNVSPWCAAFLPEDIKVVEYQEDLKYYYKSGYGSGFHSNLMCAAVQDMLTNLQSDQMPDVIAYFSHVPANLLLLTALEYAKDSEALKGSNYDQMKNRKFRSSILAPFAGNLAAVKYE